MSHQHGGKRPRALSAGHGVPARNQCTWVTSNSMSPQGRVGTKKMSREPSVGDGFAVLPDSLLAAVLERVGAEKLPGRYRCRDGEEECTGEGEWAEDSDDEEQPRGRGHGGRWGTGVRAELEGRAAGAAQARPWDGSAKQVLVSRRWRDVSREAQRHLRTRPLGRGRRLEPLVLARQLGMYPSLSSLHVSPGSLTLLCDHFLEVLMGEKQAPAPRCSRLRPCVCQCRRSTLECLVLENAAEQWDVSTAGLRALFSPCSCLCAACSAHSPPAQRASRLKVVRLLGFSQESRHFAPTHCCHSAGALQPRDVARPLEALQGHARMRGGCADGAPEPWREDPGGSPSQANETRDSVTHAAKEHRTAATSHGCISRAARAPGGGDQSGARAEGDAATILPPDAHATGEGQFGMAAGHLAVLAGCPVALPGTWSELRRLEYFHSDLTLDRIPEGISNLGNLAHLSVHVAATHLPDTLCMLSGLRCLALVAPNLQALPLGIGALRSLRSLHLRTGRTLPEIPQSIGELRQLRKLDLRCPAPGLQELPESLGSLSGLRALRLRCKGLLRMLPDSVGGLRSLEELRIHSCPMLISMPLSFTQLTELRSITIVHTRLLDSLHEYLLALQSQPRVNLRHCHVIQTDLFPLHPAPAEPFSWTWQVAMGLAILLLLCCIPWLSTP